MDNQNTVDETTKAIEEQKAKLEQAEEERIRRVKEQDAIWAAKTKGPGADAAAGLEEARLKAGE